MSQSGPPPIIFVLGALLLAGGGYYWYTLQGKDPLATVRNAIDKSQSPAQLTVPQSLPANAGIKIDGSTSMVRLNVNLGKLFQKKFPTASYTWQANGSSKGIKALLDGTVDLAASSRALKPEEVSQGLVAVPVKNDAIAVIVGRGNPFRGELTLEQLKQIFTGTLKNWSDVGGPPLPLRVINRNPESGTYKQFEDTVLGGGSFGSGPNWTTMPRDVTTELIQKLGTNGIGYANYSQIRDQKTIRAVALEGASPDAANYPIVSILYYVYGPNSSEAAKAFVALATSTEGQAVAVID